MKEVQLISLDMRNFKGQRHRRLDFGGNSAHIYGDNGTGKTTVFDAFSWLLFGVDSLGQSAFDIKPLDADGQTADHGAVTEVEAVLQVDGVERKLKRTFYERWSRKRGSVNETYDGNTSDYFVDEVPVKKKLFDETVREMVGDNKTFRMLTDLRYFCEVLPWRERREILMDMCWHTDDKTVMEQDERFAPLLEAVGRLSLDEYRTMLSAKRKNISGARDKIPTRLDELDRMLEQVAPCDYDAVRAELEVLRERLQTVQSASDQPGRAADIEHQRRELRMLEDQLGYLDDANQLHKASYPRPDVLKLERVENGMAKELEALERKRSNHKDDIARLTAQLERMREKWRAVNALEFDADTCPTCGQELPPEQRREKRERFAEQKAHDLESIQMNASVLQKSISLDEEMMERVDEEAAKTAAMLEHTRLELAKARTEAAKPVPDMPDYAEKKAALEAAARQAETVLEQMQAEAAEDDATEVVAGIQADIRQREALLAEELMVESNRKRRAELEAEQRKMSAALEALDYLLNLAEEYVRFRVALIDDTVSSHFRHVKFKLFREQVNGGLAECCDVTVDGVPYSTALNKGAQCNAGIDVIRTLSEHYGAKVPLFVDNGESVTCLDDAGTQMIILEVSREDKELRLA